ncbi:MAG: hypothetical protein ACKO5E_21365 [bacterium]
MIETALKPALTIYREDQLFAPWVYLILGLIGGNLIFPHLPPLKNINDIRPTTDPANYAVFTVILLITACLMKMTTEVGPDGLCISFGWLPIYRTHVKLHEIKSIEPCTYRPLFDTLGWGIRRTWKGETVLSARGNRAVRITRNDGSVLLVGSQKAEELAAVIDSTRRSLMI